MRGKCLNKTRKSGVTTVTNSKLPKTQEQYSSHIPALKTLLACGWRYLSAKDCLKQRGSTRDLLLKTDLIAYLQTRRFEYKGQQVFLWQPAHV